MKKLVSITLLLCLLSVNVMSQINANPNTDGPVWMTGDCNPLIDCFFDDITVLHLSDTSQNTDLPRRVRNDTLKYFPPIYYQGNVCCCTFASEIGYVFTYEMNRIRDVSSGLAWSLGEGVDTIDLQNLYHPLFGYNFVNDGNYQRFTCQADGFRLLQSIGCPMYDYYYTRLMESPGQDALKAKYWMSSYNGYADAIRQKVDSIYQIQFNPYFYNTFDTLKHWLYDHNEGEGSIGGLASIAILTGGDSIVTLQNWDSMYYRLGTDQETGHVVTIVGYDDEICYDLNHNGHIEQDEYGAFRVANSWGTNWGSGGFIWLPYKLMRNLQDNRRMAFCCTVKECEPTVYVKATWEHPHQYAKRNSFYPVLGIRKQSNDAMFYYQGAIEYPIFHRQGGSHTLQGINDFDTICIGFDYSCLFPDLDNAGKYFIRMHNSSNTTGNKIKNLSIVDYRWNEIFEMPYDGMEISIDDSYTIIGLKYELLPFDQPIDSSKAYNRDVVARRRTTVSGNNACLQFSNKATVDMYGTNAYDSELYIDVGTVLNIGDTCSIIARSGNCRVIVKGTMTLGQGVTFEARDGATLEIIFENNADLAISNASFINCDLVLPQKNISFTNCHFIGTPLAAEIHSIVSGNHAITLANCNFVPNGRVISDAIYIKHYSYYLVQGCSVDASGEGSYDYGISIYNSGSDIGAKCVRDNLVTGCQNAGILVYASYGDIRTNTIEGNGYGVKLFNNSNIERLTGNCRATTASGTQYIHDNEKYEVFMTSNCIPETFRYNYISDDDNIPFVYYDASIGFVDPGTPSRSNIDVSLNYWGINFSYSTHLNSNSLTTSYDYLPFWSMGQCANVNKTSAELLLAEADSLNNVGEYALARSVYMQLADDYPNTVSAETALKTLLVLEELAGNNYDSLKSYYLTNDAIASDENLSHLASSLANKCDERLGNYEEAIGWYEDVLTNPNTSFNDSIFAAIDLGDLYLRMIEGVEKVTYGKMTQYKPESIQAHKLHTYAALDLLPKVQLTNTLRKRDLSSIVNFEIEITENDTVFLDWDIPADVTEATLSWSNMIQYNALGMAAGQCATDQAVRFNTTDTEDFVGWRIKDVSVILSSSDTTTGFPEPNYSIRIWKGTGNAFEQVYEKDIIDPEYSVPFTVPIDDLVCVEEDRDLLIGYSLDKYTTFPWVVDNRQQNGKEFWYMFYHRNYPETDCLADNYWYNTEDYPSGSLCVAATIISSDSFTTNKNIASLTGYRIYRDGTLIKEIPYSFVTYFTDTEFTRETEVEYCVTAVYGEEESEPVCATAVITDVADELGNDGISISPNPTNGFVHIEGVTVAEVQVYNTMGQLVKTVRNSNEINLKGLPRGVYTVFIADKDGNYVIRKVVVE